MTLLVERFLVSNYMYPSSDKAITIMRRFIARLHVRIGPFTTIKV